MTFAGTRCPTCRSLNVAVTLRTWCATYLHCNHCGDMWTVRHHTDADQRDRDDAAHPMRRQSDTGAEASRH